MLHAPNRFASSLLAFLMLLWATGLVAAPDAQAVSLLVDERFVSAFQEDCPPFLSECILDWNDRADPSAPFAPFDANVQNVTQTSSVGPLLFTAVGSAWHFEDPNDDAFTRDVSDFSIVFSLSSTLDYQAIFTYGQNAFLALQNLGTGDFVNLGGDFDGFETVGDTQGQLTPGDYRLQARAEEGDISQDPGFYDLVFSIPEPGTAVLASLALATLVAVAISKS